MLLAVLHNIFYMHAFFTKYLLRDYYTRYLGYRLGQDKHILCPHRIDSLGGKADIKKKRMLNFFKYRVLEEAITGSSSMCKALYCGAGEKIL